MTNPFKSRKRKKEEEARKKVQAFLDEFKALSKKHGYTFYARLKASDTGIVPVIQVEKNPE